MNELKTFNTLGDMEAKRSKKKKQDVERVVLDKR